MLLLKENNYRYSLYSYFRLSGDITNENNFEKKNNGKRMNKGNQIKTEKKNSMKLLLILKMVIFLPKMVTLILLEIKSI